MVDSFWCLILSIHTCKLRGDCSIRAIASCANGAG